EGSDQSTVNLDLLLRSQLSLAQAEISYWQAIISYNQAIADVHLRQGTLLEQYGITLSEGGWTPEAYQRAIREAWARSHAIENPLLHTESDPFAIPGECLPTQVPGPLYREAMPSSEYDANPVPPAPAPIDPSRPELLPETAPPNGDAPDEFGSPNSLPTNEDDREGRGPVLPASEFGPAEQSSSDDSTAVRPRSPLSHVRIIRGINR